MAIRKRVDLSTKKIDGIVNKLARQAVLDRLPSHTRGQFGQGKLKVRSLADRNVYRLRLTLTHFRTRKTVSAQVVLNMPIYHTSSELVYEAGRELGRKIAEEMETFVQNNVSPEATRVSSLVSPHIIEEHTKAFLDSFRPSDTLILDELTSKKKKPVKKPANDSIYPPWREI